MRGCLVAPRVLVGTSLAILGIDHFGLFIRGGLATALGSKSRSPQRNAHNCQRADKQRAHFHPTIARRPSE